MKGEWGKKEKKGCEWGRRLGWKLQGGWRARAYATTCRPSWRALGALGAGAIASLLLRHCCFGKAASRGTMGCVPPPALVPAGPPISCGGADVGGAWSEEERKHVQNKVKARPENCRACRPPPPFATHHSHPHMQEPGRDQPRTLTAFQNSCDVSLPCGIRRSPLGDSGSMSLRSCLVVVLVRVERGKWWVGDGQTQ